MVMQHRRFIITGKVQGVFFRAATRDKARALGVKGLVSNRSDDSVCVEAEATVELLDEFLAWLHQGPPEARVDDVKAEQGELKGYHDFEIFR